MNSENITEGYMPYLGHKTYYRIVGKSGGKTPLVLLHGGPGSTHNYFEVLDSIANTGRQVIMYDQIGCGKSYLDGHPELWTKETWINELIALRNYLHLNEIHLLGQSGGGMQAIAYLIDEKPVGVKSVILSSTLSSSKLWADEQHKLIAQLSEKDQQAILQAEVTKNWDDSAYLLANEHYYAAFVTSNNANTPECVTRKKKVGHEAYLYGWGPNEYQPTGSLRDFYYTDRLHEIKIPALIISGSRDICTPTVARTLKEGIPESQWELFEGARHMCFVEQNDKYCKLLSKFLAEHD